LVHEPEPELEPEVPELEPEAPELEPDEPELDPDVPDELVPDVPELDEDDELDDEQAKSVTREEAARRQRSRFIAEVEQRGAGHGQILDN
jgi:hypothetical protein